MITKAIIPVAGLGTRFLPATIAQPKEMLPLVDKPAIQFVVEEAVNAGLDDIVLITGKNKRAIEDHFDPNPDLLQLLKKKNQHDLIEQVNCVANLGNFFYVRQKKPLGTGHAILQAEKHIDEENFAIMMGDTVIDQKKPCIGEMAKIFQKFQMPVIAVEEVDKKEISQYGVVKVSKKISDNVFEISAVVEKPKPQYAPSNLAISARYIFPPDIFSLLKQVKPQSSGEIYLTDAIAQYLKNKKILVYKIEGERLDIGSKLEYAKAFVKFGLKHPEIMEEFNKYLQNK